MTKIKRSIALVSLFALLIGSVSVGCKRANESFPLLKQPQQHDSKKQENSRAFEELSHIVDQYVASTLQEGNINSLAIAIYKEGQVYQQYYGVLDPKSNQRPTDSTLYEIASISKVFLGSLVAQAVLEKKIALKDDIRMYLTGEYTNLQFEGTPITIQNLLTHTLGIKGKAPKELDQVYRQVRKGYYENKPFTYQMTDLLRELKTVQLDKKPGTVYEYNSVGPELLAYILEQVYHKLYKELVQDFLNEVNLPHTHLGDYEKYKQQLATSFDENGKVATLLKNPLLGGSHSMISTLPDLTKFMQFQLESNNPLIKESTQLLFKDEIDGDNKGYLWDVGYGQKEGAYYGKTGTSNGVQSGMLICPDSNYGMILVMNNTSEAAQNDWLNLYNRIETELIQYPKINLVYLLEKEFTNNLKQAKEKYNILKKDTVHYRSGAFYFNSLGYELIQSNQIEKAIALFEFAISEDVNNANLYDSLGEAYYLAKEYKKALNNYEKSLVLNPKNENAKQYIEKIKQLKHLN